MRSLVWVLAIGTGAMGACDSFQADPGTPVDAGAEASALPDTGPSAVVVMHDDATADVTSPPPVPDDAQSFDGTAVLDAQADAQADSGCLPSQAPLGMTTRSLFTRVLGGENRSPFGIVTDADNVYWLEQYAPSPNDGGPNMNAYDGAAFARVRRVSKQGGATATLVETQRYATALAIDNGNLYWGNEEIGDGGPIREVVRKMPANCTGASCVATVAFSFQTSTRITHLLLLRPKVLVVQFSNGESSLLDLSGAAQATPIVVTKDFPSVAVAPGNVFLGAAPRQQLTRVDFTPALQATNISLPALDAGLNQGAVQLAVDCASIWIYRGDGWIWRAAHDGSSLARFVETKVPDSVFAMTNDARYIYLSVANAGGVFAYDKTTKQRTTVSPGNVWFTAVDDDGVYWGEHDRNAGGSIFMNVKK